MSNSICPKVLMSLCVLTSAAAASSQALPAPRSYDPIFRPVFSKTPARTNLPPQPQPQPNGPAMPPPLSFVWPEYACIVVQAAPLVNSGAHPFQGMGPRSNWIPVYSFSVEKDLLSTPKDPHFLVKFLVRSGPWSDQFVTASNSIWFYDFQFHAVARPGEKPTVIAGRGNVRNVRWFWENNRDPGLYGEVLIDTSKYYLSSP